MEAYDVVIIGAGHNGIVCAGYLISSGLAKSLPFLVGKVILVTDDQSKRKLLK